MLKRTAVTLCSAPVVNLELYRQRVDGENTTTVDVRIITEFLFSLGSAFVICMMRLLKQLEGCT